MREARQIRAALAAGVVVAGLIAGCGQGDGDADVSTQAEDALPRELTPGLVTAGDGAGWVAGVIAGQDVERLWRLTPDGAATEVTELPDMVSTGGAALNDDRLAVVGIRCAGGEGDPADGCRAWGIDVLVINADGEMTKVALFEDETPLDDGDGLQIAGSTGDSVWISTEPGVFEVSADGAVLQRLPAAPGSECVIDGQLYRIVNPEAPADSTQGSSPPVTAANPDEQVADTRAIEIQRLEGDTFTPVPGGRREIDGVANARLRCTDSAVETASFDGELIDRWTPTDGWREPSGVPAPALAATTTDSAMFALDQDGTVLERGQNGAFNAVGIRLPTLTEPGEMPANLKADRSLSIVIACTTRSTSQTDTETVCKTAAAG